MYKIGKTNYTISGMNTDVYSVRKKFLWWWIPVSLPTLKEDFFELDKLIYDDKQVGFFSEKEAKKLLDSLSKLDISSYNGHTVYKFIYLKDNSIVYSLYRKPSHINMIARNFEEIDKLITLKEALK